MRSDCTHISMRMYIHTYAAYRPKEPTARGYYSRHPGIVAPGTVCGIHSLFRHVLERRPVVRAHVGGSLRDLLDVRNQSMLVCVLHCLHGLNEGLFVVTLNHTPKQQHHQLLQLIQTLVCRLQNTKQWKLVKTNSLTVNFCI